MKTKVITLSGISAALVAIVLILGVYLSEIFDIFALMFAPAFLCMPLYVDSKKGAFLSYLAGGLIAVLFTGGQITNYVFFAYFLFAGIFPIVKYIAVTKRFNKVLFNVLCMIWFVAFAVGFYYYYTAFLGFPIEMVFNIDPKIYPLIVGICSAAVYFLINGYVFSLQLIVFRLLKRIIKEEQK